MRGLRGPYSRQRWGHGRASKYRRFGRYSWYCKQSLTKAGESLASRFRDLEANQARRGDMNRDQEPAISADTALSCLFKLGAQNGVYTEFGPVRRRHLVDSDTLQPSQLIDIALEFGLKAEPTQLDWKALQNQTFTHPLLLILKNGNVAILMGVRRDGPEEVAISDPLFRDGTPFFLPRQQLEQSWNGQAVIVTPLPPPA